MSLPIRWIGYQIAIYSLREQPREGPSQISRKWSPYTVDLDSAGQLPRAILAANENRRFFNGRAVCQKN